MFNLSAIILLLIVPPVFTKIPDRAITVRKRFTASIVCEAFGSPPPVIQWSRAFSVPLPQGRSVVVNGTLKISRFSPQDSGSYQCKATNKLGSITTITALNFREGERYQLNKLFENDSNWLDYS